MENENLEYEARKANYEDKKERRIEKYKTRAIKASSNSKQHQNRAYKAIEGIVPGQPILVGHHSEKSHRSALKKHDTQMRKTIDEQKKAEYYAEKAISAESNTAISSDDPDAIKRLQEKIDILKIEQDFMKCANREYKKLKIAKEKGEKYTMQLTDEEKEKVLNTVRENARLGLEYYGCPFPSFELTSVNNKIKEAEKRIEKLRAFEKMEVKAGKYKIDGIPECEFEKDKIENRFKIYPPKKERSFSLGLPGIFKTYGFHWSGYNRCYQRQLSGLDYTETRIIEELKKVFVNV